MTSKSIFGLLIVIGMMSYSVPSIGQTKADSVLVKTQSFVNSILNKTVDTSYIEDLRNEVSVKLLGVFKFTSFNVKDSDTKAGIRYRPDRQLNLGLGYAHKWFAIDMAFDVGIKENADDIDSKFFNFTGKVFGRRSYIEGTYQYYYGYQVDFIKNVEYDPDDVANSRDDIRTIKIGLQYLYSFNYDKFSIQAPFVLNEVQRKSAGSFLAGVQFSQYTMDADSSVIPGAIAYAYSSELQMRDVNVASLGVNFGYMYSLIIKKRGFFTLGFIPAINYNFGDFLTQNRLNFDRHFSFGYTTMNAFGYNSRRFFTGFQFSLTANFVRIQKEGTLAIRYGNAKYFIGYRFKTKKSRAIEALQK